MKSILQNLDRTPESAVFATFGTEFCQISNFQLSESAKVHKTQKSEPLNVIDKTAHLALLESQKLISRKT